MNPLNDASVALHQPNLHVHRELCGPRHLTDVVYADQIVSRGLRHLRYLQSPGDLELVPEVEGLGSILCSDRTNARREWVLEIDEAIALVALGRESVDANVAAPTARALDETVGRLTDALRPSEDDEQRVWITFWAGDREGRVTAAARKVPMPNWDEVEPDHPTATRTALNELVRADRPEHGSLILWHGPPGTGKTYAARALARAWQDWCVPHFITDPELFLGDASYLMRVLTSSDPDNLRDRDWQLLILEDSGELLTADARERTGQALSRLLNATDGLVGQSTNTLVLVTTNEPVGKLHPALTRQGRCLSEVEFDALPTEDANAWLVERGSSISMTSPTVIADLYAAKAGRASRGEERHVGFAA